MLYKKVYSWLLHKSKFDFSWGFQSTGDDALKKCKDYDFLPFPLLIYIRLNFGTYNYNKILINKNICQILSLEYRPANQ